MLTGLITIENQLLKKNDKLPQYTDDTLSSQDSRLCLPFNFFRSASDFLVNIHMLICALSNKLATNIPTFYVFKNSYLFLIMLVLMSNRINLAENKAAILLFFELSPCFNHNISLFFLFL